MDTWEIFASFLSQELFTGSGPSIKECLGKSETLNREERREGGRINKALEYRALCG